MPYYLCPAIRLSAISENCKIHFYHIDKNFCPKFKFPPNSFILYPNYFGICNEIVDRLCTKYPNVIVDNAHSLFSKPKGIASFYSLRKFIPNLKEGAFLYIKSNNELHIDKNDFYYELKNMTYNELCLNESRLDKEPIKCISDCTLNYIDKINFEKIRNERISNFNYWNKILGNNNALDLSGIYDAPFGYPYLANTPKDADNLVIKLNQQNKTIFKYWQNMPDSYEENIFFRNLVIISP